MFSFGCIFPYQFICYFNIHLLPSNVCVHRLQPYCLFSSESILGEMRIYVTLVTHIEKKKNVYKC